MSKSKLQKIRRELILAAYNDVTLFGHIGQGTRRDAESLRHQSQKRRNTAQSND